LASNPGTCSAIVSVKRSIPRSTSSHTAHAVITFVFEYSSHNVSSAAGCRVGSRVASPKARTSASFPRRANAICAPGYRPLRMCPSMILASRSSGSGANPNAADVDEASGKFMEPSGGLRV
jgi:hypothetical protein